MGLSNTATQMLKLVMGTKENVKQVSVSESEFR